MKALVIGATGATGKDLVNQLLQDDDFSEVNIFVRKPIDNNSPKLKVHIINFDKLDISQDLVNGDVLFSCLGTTLKNAGTKEAQRKIDFTYQYNFAKIAKENNIENYILVSSFGANSSSSIFYSKMKGELEDAVKQLNFNNITIFKPGMLDRKNTNRIAEILGLRLIKFFNTIGLLKKQKPLPTTILAKAMIVASKTKGKNCIELNDIFAFTKQKI